MSATRQLPLPKAVVLGASGHAKVVLDILSRQGLYDVVGLLDSYKLVGSECAGYRVMGRPSDLPALLAQHSSLGVVVAIGDNWSRATVAREIRQLCPNIAFLTAIHPSAQIASDVCIGAGTVIMAGVVVNPGVRIGEFCILNTRSSLDHDSTMEDYSSLGPAVTTGGGVRVGNYSNIGIGATVVQEISIGAHSVVGAGAVVLRPVPDHVVAYGTPARVVRSRTRGERYLSESPLANGVK